MKILVMIFCAVAAMAAQSPAAEYAKKTADPSLTKGPVGIDAIRVPEGFEVSLAADSSLAPYPMCACLDDRGRLFLTDSSGKNVNGEAMAATRECRIQLLVDSNGDGVYDKATTFADELSLPMGCCWHDGSLYVANPPEFIRLEDTDDDGVADVYEIVHEGWNVKNTASLHGPFLGPDGWLYLTHGRHGYNIETREGETLAGEAARIWRCRPDGSGLERVCGGGFDNPVEMIFTPAGEMIGTMTYYTDPRNGERDALMHWHEGGVYPKPHSSISEFLQTGELMPTMTKFARIAPAGLMQVRGTVLGAEYHGNLFTAQFNPHRIQRHTLHRHGDTFRTVDSDFLTSVDPDFFPTDILEDPDGSLLVLDTGAWYVDACPVSRVARPEIKGSVYRIRRTGATPSADPRGNEIDFASLSEQGLVKLLADSRHAVRDRAAEHLEALGDKALPALAAGLEILDGTEARCQAVWTACRIGSRPALRVLAQGMKDPDKDVRTAAAMGAGRLDAADLIDPLIGLMSDPHLPIRREAATALGRIGDPKAVPALLASATGLEHRFLDHALILALVRIDQPEPLLQALESGNPHQIRIALTALDALKPSPLNGELAARFLAAEDPDLRRRALWVASRHSEWGADAAGFLQSQIQKSDLTVTEAEGLHQALHGLVASKEIQSLIAKSIRDASLPTDRRLFLLEAASGAPLTKLPPAWIEALESVLFDRTAPGSLRWESLRVVQTRKVDVFDERLRKLGSDFEESPELRVAALAAAVPRDPVLTELEFLFLVSRLDPNLDSTSRLTAAQVLGRSALSSDQQVELAQGPVAAADALILPALLDSFASGTERRVGLALVDALLATEVRVNFLGGGKLDVLFAGYPQEVRERAAPIWEKIAEEERNRGEKMREFESLLTGGDVGRGRRVFFGSKAACGTCHAVGLEGGILGPDLTMIGAIRQGRDLLEAILFPSASFVPDYESYRLETHDGDVLTGVIGAQDADSILFRTGADAEMRVPRDEVLHLDLSSLSIMPEGLDVGLTSEEMADLLAFLQSLNGGDFLEPTYAERN